MLSTLQASSLLFSTGVLVIFSTNPIHSVLYLILTFLVTTLFFLSLKIEFLALLFIVIYVGAIAVLFLFVVMMLNIKITEISKKLTIYLPMGLLLMLVLFSEVYYVSIQNKLPPYLKQDTSQFLIYLFDTGILDFLLSNSIFNYAKALYNKADVEIIGYIMYSDFGYLVLLAAMLLFAAMVISITLTETFDKVTKSQEYYNQTNSKTITAIYFVK